MQMHKVFIQALHREVTILGLEQIQETSCVEHRLQMQRVL
jgi:hypothetical protein